MFELSRKLRFEIIHPFINSSIFYRPKIVRIELFYYATSLIQRNILRNKKTWKYK